MKRTTLGEVIKLLRKVQWCYITEVTWKQNENFLDIHVQIPAWAAMQMARLNLDPPEIS